MSPCTPALPCLLPSGPPSGLRSARALAVGLALWGAAGPAAAGSVVVEAAVATEVMLDELPIVRTYGPGTVTLPDMAPGEHTFQVFRGGDGAPISVVVPQEGVVRLLIGKDSLSTDSSPPVAPVEGAPPPRVLLKAHAGQRFGVVVDGKRFATLHAEQPLRLDSLGPGSHQLELRSPDHLTVWARAELQLQPGDELAITVQEGKLPEAFGREGAYTAR